MRNWVLRGLMALALCAAWMFSAEAKELPTVVWTRDVYGVDDTDKNIQKEWHLLTDEGKARIAEAITRKLEEQQKQGKLPFKLAEASAEQERNAEIMAESPISIVPIVVTDAAFHWEYKVKEQDLHKYVLASALDIAFCSVDEGGALQMLANIPLHFYTVLPESGALHDMRKLAPEEQQELYTRFTVRMIEQGLDFAKEKRLLRHIEDKAEGIEDTYQVTDVVISSPKAQEVFAGYNGARAAYVKKVVGDMFSSAYARRTGHVVFPSRASGTWNDDAVKGTYSLRLSSMHSGEKVMVLPPPDHPITLDVTGVGKQEIETKKKSYVNGFMGYKVWLAKSFVEGKEEKEATNWTQQEFIRLQSGAINIEDHDVFRMLLIGAAVTLGDQKID